MRKFYQSVTPKFTTPIRLICILFFSTLFLFSSKSNAQAGSNLLYDGTGGAGTEDFVTMPAGIVSTVTGDFTIEAWIYWTGGPSLAWQRVLDFGNDGNNSIFLTPYSSIPSNGARFAVVVGGTAQVIDAAAPITQNTWTHIAVTVDDATDVGTIYVNGTSSGTTLGFTFHLSDLGATVNNWLGKSEFADPYFNGNIEELRISNVVRYTANFTPQTTEFVSDANTVALYHFDESVGQTTADATGIHADGILGSTVAVEGSDPTWVFASVLPVKLAEFSASLNARDKAVDIKWTASLDQPGKFTIERSNNGREFIPVTTISVPAGTNSLETFNYRDNDPLAGRNYYRLKAIEEGSAPVYSRIVAVNFSSKDELVIYPNPVKGNKINIELTKPYTGDLMISLINSSGAVVFRQKINAVDRREFQVTRNVPSGSYLLEITKDGVKQSKMIVCQ